MTKIDKFEIKLLETLDKYKMIDNGDRILVALSGGKDSVALLCALNKLSNYLNIQLFAFHLNHGIRGAEADSDERFSRDLCEKLNVPFYSSYVDVPSKASDSSDGIEAIARNVRYAELTRISQQCEANKIATAHTASDNSETLLISLLRNSNAKGIPPVRGNIIRPLICHTTNEVVEYCKRNSLLFVTDSTNADDNYTRNYIRHNILSKLYELAPSFDRSALDFSDIQRSNVALTDVAVKDYYNNNKDPLMLSSLESLANNVAYHNVLFSVLNTALPVELSFRQFENIKSLILSGRTGQSVNISGGYYVTKGYEKIEFSNESRKLSDYELKIEPGPNYIPDSDLILWLETPDEYEKRNKENELKCLKVNKLTKNILIKYNIMNLCLIARSRKPGDSYVCRGMTRSVKKFMIDEKIPADLRSRIPIVCDDYGIIWVAGLGIADRIKTENDADGIISLSLDYKKTDS